MENVNRESDALGAYRNASELYQQMGLDADVQDCNNAIERISQPKAPVVSRRGCVGCGVGFALGFGSNIDSYQVAKVSIV